MCLVKKQLLVSWIAVLFSSSDAAAYHTHSSTRSPDDQPSTQSALEDQQGSTAGEEAMWREGSNFHKKPATDELEQVLQYSTRVHNVTSAAIP